MQQAPRGWRRLTVLGAVVVLAASACGSSTSSGGQSVTVIGTWAGSEQEAFLAMVKPWETSTGNTVKYTGTRDINTVLTTGVASGVLPDLAGLPGPGQMAEYAASGALKPLDSVLDIATYKSETAPALVDLGTVDGKLVGVFIKAAVKGLIWYNPQVHDYASAPPATFDDLMTQAQANKGRRIGAVVPGPRQRRGLRLAGHRLDRGHRPPPGRPAGLQRLVGRQGQVDLDPRSRRRSSSTSTTSSQEHRRPDCRGRSDQGLQPRRRPALHQPARLRGLPPGELHHRPRRLQGQDGRHRLQLLPLPGHQQPVRRLRRGRGRPVRHVP